MAGNPPFVPVYPNAVDPALVLPASGAVVDANLLARFDTQIRAIQQQLLNPTGPWIPQIPSPLTGPASLKPVSQFVPVNTRALAAAFTQYMPTVVGGGIMVAYGDSGKSFDQYPLTVHGNGFPIYCAYGPGIGTLQNTILLSDKGMTQNFVLIADPAQTFWLPCGSGLTPNSPLGVIIAPAVLSWQTQFVPANTKVNAKSYTQYMPAPPATQTALQIMFSDSGRSWDQYPLTVHGNGIPIYQPWGSNNVIGTMQPTLTMNQKAGSVCLNLVIADPTYGTHYMPG